MEGGSWDSQSTNEKDALLRDINQMLVRNWLWGIFYTDGKRKQNI